MRVVDASGRLSCDFRNPFHDEIEGSIHTGCFEQEEILVFVESVPASDAGGSTDLGAALMRSRTPEAELQE